MVPNEAFENVTERTQSLEECRSFKNNQVLGEGCTFTGCFTVRRYTLEGTSTPPLPGCLKTPFRLPAEPAQLDVWSRTRTLTSCYIHS